MSRGDGETAPPGARVVGLHEASPQEVAELLRDMADEAEEMSARVALVALKGPDGLRTAFVGGTFDLLGLSRWIEMEITSREWVTERPDLDGA